MAQAVLMPQVGQDIETAILVEWTAQVGDAVKPDDVIALVESDKATFEVQALEAGVLLKQLLGEGEEGKVLEPIAWIGQPGEQIEPDIGADESSPKPEAPQIESVAPAASMPSEGEHVAVAPAARRIARERGVDLSTVTGTGPGGRILKEDVLAAAAQRPSSEGVVFSKLRRKVAERLTYSQRNIPHFYLYVDVNMSEALKWRRNYNQEAAVKATITDMIVQAVGRSLTRFPKLNAHVADDKMILHQDINIGIAVSVEDGLVVPVLARADTLSLEQISQQVRENAEGARGGVLRPQATGTFTISNLGMHGVGMFLPIINPPECAILGVGAVTKRPYVTDATELRVAEVVTLALACDHRAVDGTYAAAFLDELKQILEHFSD
ncbi:MAG: 2-oxo acid dehydrogenase subunit E2 [Phycisphaerales bacterium]|nr:MAG: 2-oxo acid dehydrogenase subunit E2 [Phycisphaerales bacterium]